MPRHRNADESSQLIIRQNKRSKKAENSETGEPNFKLRLKEPIRDALERSANRRGISMNSEASERLESAFFTEEVINFFFRSGTSIEEVLILRRYLVALKQSVELAGDIPERCWVYAPFAGFPLNLDALGEGWQQGNLDAAAFDIPGMALRIRSGVICAAADDIERNGPPILAGRSQEGEERKQALRLWQFKKACRFLNLAIEQDAATELLPRGTVIYLAAKELACDLGRGEAPEIEALAAMKLT
ncbi:Arc family DNA-binding protein [Paramagnetospirillum magneticum]|uniref:Arc family DNA-binding protein n=1 Tax=Paramagnetospirillum magneticum TaxID=84159 RepID=UPI000A0200AD|nr:Arc family DNA-binding protein [Paramagnetospirillum magneticum]